MQRSEPLPPGPPRKDPDDVSKVTVQGTVLLSFSFDATLTRDSYRQLKNETDQGVWELATGASDDLPVEKRDIAYLGVDVLEISEWGVSV